MKLLIAILFFSTFAIAQPTSSKQLPKGPIHFDSVQTIYLKKSSLPHDSLYLTPEQIKMLGTAWNASKPIGTYKFLPEYWIVLTTKSGTTRKFRTHQDKIKENTDVTFSVKDTAFFSSLWNATYPYPNPKRYHPISFIQEVSKKLQGENMYTAHYITMTGKFPSDWVKEEHIDSLMAILDSKDSCRCYVSPLSSYIPQEAAEKGGFAATFIKAYKDKEPVSLGLYACPKVNPTLNEELKKWWTELKK